MQINNTNQASEIPNFSFQQFELEAAVTEKNIAEVKRLLKSDVRLLTQHTDSGAYLVRLAIEAQEAEIINLLLQNGAKLGDVDKDNIPIFLYLAIEVGQLDTVKVLFEYVPVLSAEAMKELLAAACDFCRLNIVQFLLEKGADPAGTDTLGKPIIFHAIYCVDEEELEADIAECVAKDSDFEIVKLLLERGASAHAIDPVGNPILCRAIERGSAAIVQCLIDYGARCDGVNNEQVPFINIALTNDIKNYQIIKLILGVNDSITKDQLITALLNGCDGSALNYLLSFAQVGVVDSEVISLAIHELCNPTKHFFEIQEVEDQELCELRRDSHQRTDDLEIFRLLVSKMLPLTVSKQNLEDAIEQNLPLEAMQVLLEQTDEKVVDTKLLEFAIQHNCKGANFEKVLLKKKFDTLDQNDICIAIAGGVSSTVFGKLLMKTENGNIDFSQLMAHAVVNKNFEIFEFLLDCNKPLSHNEQIDFLVSAIHFDCSSHLLKKLFSHLSPAILSINVLLYGLKNREKFANEIMIEKLNADSITVKQLLSAMRLGASTPVMKKLLKQTPSGACNQEVLRLAISSQVDIIRELLADNPQLVVTHELFRLAAACASARMDKIKISKKEGLITQEAANEEIALVKAQLELLSQKLKIAKTNF